MDVTKFLWLIQHRALYLNRLDRLGDLYEGHHTSIMAKSISIHAEHLKRMAISEHSQKNQPLPGDFTDAYFEDQAKIDLLSPPKSKVRNYVSCWHLNDYESYAMWKIYGQNTDTLSVQTTFKKLNDALSGQFYIGMVNYIDYDTDMIDISNLYNYVMHKRKYFSYENEVRIVYSPMYDKGGVFIERAIDLENVVERIYLSPFSTPSFKEVIEGLLQKYDLKIAVVQSIQGNEPEY